MLGSYTRVFTVCGSCAIRGIKFALCVYARYIFVSDREKGT